MMRKAKRGVKRLFFVWRAIVIALLSAALIPLFLQHGRGNGFYLWTVPPGILIYLIITAIHLRLGRGVVKEYLEESATRLFLGVTALAAAFLFLLAGNGPWTAALLVAGAVLYAMFLSRISFLRVIGL